MDSKVCPRHPKARTEKCGTDLVCVECGRIIIYGFVGRTAVQFGDSPLVPSGSKLGESFFGKLP